MSDASGWLASLPEQAWLGLCSLGKQVANVVHGTRVGGRVGTGGAPNTPLIHNHAGTMASNKLIMHKAGTCYKM